MMWFVCHACSQQRKKEQWLQDHCWSKPHIDYNLIPGVVYILHEVRCGTEEQLKEAGIAYNLFSIQSSRSRVQVLI
jgi:hypothetical protein